MSTNHTGLSVTQMMLFNQCMPMLQDSQQEQSKTKPCLIKLRHGHNLQAPPGLLPCCSGCWLGQGQHWAAAATALQRRKGSPPLLQLRQGLPLPLWPKAARQPHSASTPASRVHTVSMPRARAGGSSVGRARKGDGAHTHALGTRTRRVTPPSPNFQLPQRPMRRAPTAQRRRCPQAACAFIEPTALQA